MFKKIITLSTLLTLLIPSMVFAQGTVLPSNPEGDVLEIYQSRLNGDEELQKIYSSACDLFLYEKGRDNGGLKNYITEADRKDQNEALGCAIESGRLSLWMLPLFISYIANFFIGIAGTVSVLFVLLGGFWYMTGGITDDKEKGKKTITYALIGLSITLLAWILVNIIQVAIT
jgi:hypothetical protein